MEWSITEQPHNGNESPDPPRWQSRLRINLPRLGEVIANLDLDHSGVKLSIRAQDEATLSLMRKDRQPLSEAMTSAGIKVLGIDLGAQS